MQNEFEKQVQKKMEELDFTPSEPVWINIEKQIRNKKDKRRLFIWLPLIIAFLSGSLFIVYNSQQKAAPVQKLYAKIKPNKAVVTYDNKNINNYVNKNEAITKNPSVHSKNITGNSILKNNLKYNTTDKATASFKINKAIVSRSNYQKQQSFNAISSKEIINNKRDVEESNNDLLKETDIQNINQHEKTSFPFNHFETINATALANLQREDIVKENLLANLNKTIPALNKWKLYVEFSPGLSRIIDHTSYSNTAIAYSNPGTYPSSGTPSVSGVFENGFSFQIDIGLQKQINKRFLITTGINYSFYSSKSMVGKIVKQDTVIKSYAISQYYLNTTPANNNTSGNTSPYINKLQFIGIPVTLHYKIFNNVPFSIYGGFKIQDLIASDLLIYDPSLNVYYSSKEALNHIQLFSVGGLEYTVQLGKLKINVGPEFIYGISNIVKNYNNHLQSIAASLKIYLP